MYGFRGFKDSMWRALKEQSRGLNKSTKSLLNSFDKSKFKIKKVYPSLSQRYSFRQRELLITTTTMPQKNERNPSAFSSSPNSVNVIKTMKNPRPITSGVKEVRSLIPDSHVGLKGNMGTRKMRIYRRNYGPDGFSNRPLEGAKALLGEPDKSTRVKPDLGGFKPRSSKIQQPVSRRIQRYGYNKTGKIEPGRRHGSMSENEPKLPLKTSQRSESDHRFTSDNYKKNHKIYNFHGFQPVPTRIQNAFNKTTWKSKEQTQNQPISSAFLRSAGPLKTHMKASLLNSSTSSIVRGKRVKGKQANAKKLNESNSVTNDAWKVAILRLPKIPARVKAFSHSDILGSALFSGVKAKSQTPVTPTQKKSIQNITAMIKQEAQAAHWNLNSEGAVFTKNQTISSAFLRSAGPLKTPMKASLLNSSPSSTVGGKLVKGKQANAKMLNESNSVTNDLILRLPKISARVKAYSHSDILGSALFSGVRAKSQTPVTPTQKKSIQNITAMIKQEAQAAHWNLNSEGAVFTKNQTISSAFLRSAGPLKTPMKASLLNSSPSSTVGGKLVKGKQANAKMLNESNSVTNDLILRLPKIPARVKASSHSDILGSALFSGVRAKFQTPVTPTQKKSIQNITAMIKQEAQAAHWNLNSEGAVFTKDNSSRGPEKPAEDELKDFRIVKNNTLDLGDIDLKTSDLIPDKDGSGSGDFDMSNVFSTTSKSLTEDLLELDYLRISAGNVSFKSMNVTNNDKL
nr:uncharacterized protein LOC114919982 isoform X1 [Labrus bergylta]